MDDRIVTTSMRSEDEFMENKIRPQRFEDFSGQTSVVENLRIYMQAAKLRGEPLDHVLFYGPPGLGKTTLAGIIANELGVDIKVTSGPAIGRAGDLAAILTKLNPNDVLFIDEIHRLNRAVEEVLYSAMEDFVIDFVVGKGLMPEALRFELPKFTLIGATTRAGSLSAPLRDRFGIIDKLEVYGEEDLAEIIRRSAGLLNLKVDEDALREMARCSRGTPRIANRLLKRVRDFSLVKGSDHIDMESTKRAFEAMGIDELGLEKLDREILNTIITRFKGGPVGIDTIAASIGEEKVTIEDAYEPYLIQIGLLYRTQKGRMVTEAAYHHLGLQVTGNAYKPEDDDDQSGDPIDDGQGIQESFL